MILNALEIQGFKSFPDKTKLTFDRGMTAVVGPNGSGKSNIGDALRWVLGEQSSKSLRGSKMEDVIFAGTAERKQVGFASVTLHLDNSDRSLDIDSDQVSVTRKLYRSGDSEYRINSAPVRLKDVVQLFMDTGLGKDGYAIVGQGKIADIVSSKSEERREIFEEAAGISKYRYRKKEAQRKLEQTEENLIRIKDIIGELEERIEPLAEQSEKAKKFLNLSEQKKKAEISLWVNTLESANGKLRLQQEKIDTLETKNSSISTQLTKLEEQNEVFFDKNRQLALESQENESKKRELEERFANLNAQIAVEENNLKHLEEDREELLLHSGTSLEKRETLQKEIEEHQTQLTTISLEITKLQEKEALLKEELQESLMSFSETDSKKSQLENKLMQARLHLTTLESKKFSFEDLLSRTNVNKETLTSNLETLERESGERQLELDQTKTLFEDIKRDIATRQNMLKGYGLKRENAEKAFTQIDNQVKQCNQTVFEVSQKIKINKDLDKNLDGFYFSVKTVLKAGEEHQLNGILGSVAQIVGVDNKYALAIETALGASAQHVVVQNEMVAKEAIRLLRDKKAGRATFLPLSTIKSRGVLERGVTKEEGAVAIASTLVKCESKFQQIVENLLGRTLIAEDLDSADFIARKYGHKFRVVTLDGQVIHAGGSFTGGGQVKNSGLFTRKAHIDGLKKQLQQAQEKMVGLQDKHKEHLQGVETIAAQVEKLSAQVQALNEDKIRCEGQLKQLEESLHTLQNTKQTILLDLQAIENTKKEARVSLEQTKLQLEETQQTMETLHLEIQTVGSTQSDKQQEKENLLEVISQSSLQVITLGKDKELIQNKLHNLEQAFGELEHNQKSALQSLEQIETKKELASQNIEHYKKEQIDFDRQKQVLSEVTKKLIEQQTLIEKETVDMRRAERELLEERERCGTELARATERKSNMQGEFDQIIAKLWDEYEMTRSEAQAYAEPVEDIIALKGSLSKLKDQIRKMGTVNVSAIEEYIAVKERYDFMSEQLDDIETSKKELVNMITEITKEMIVRFEYAFKEINKQFNLVFKELFGGGSASLTLTEPDNVLESGIDIFVQPPGKVIKNLSLLSGGEQSFVAIAIYFAILHVRPTSFCLLDEIEAALDDVNVSRFAEYLQTLTEHTQFIVVSHRRGTMQEADVLYGVTMQEEGVSKLLKLENRGETQAFLTGGKII